MKRRDFIVSTASAAGLLVPALGRAATPCPPGTVSVSGGTSATTTCPTSTPPPAGGASYTTNFPNVENPLSEGGRFITGRTHGLNWQNVRSLGGRACGEGVSTDRYDDNLAQLTNHSIGANQQVSATIYLESGYQAPSSHEVCLYLRMEITARNARGYEILLPRPGGLFQVMVWEGPEGGFHEITENGGSGQLPRDLRHGDVVSAKIVGNKISVYLNGTLFNTTVDSTYATGNPGMGFFIRPGGQPEKFCMTQWSAQNAT